MSRTVSPEQDPDAREPGEPGDLLALMPFAVELGITLQRATAEEVTGSLPWAPQRCTAGGLLHGGAVMALADALGAVCAYLNLPEGATTTTTESSTRFFRGLRDGSLHAVARPLHRGRSLIVVQTDLHDDHGNLTGQTTQSQAVLPAPSGHR